MQVQLLISVDILIVPYLTLLYLDAKYRFLPLVVKLRISILGKRLLDRTEVEVQCSLQAGHTSLFAATSRLDPHLFFPDTVVPRPALLESSLKKGLNAARRASNPV